MKISYILLASIMCISAFGMNEKQNEIFEEACKNLGYLKDKTLDFQQACEILSLTDKSENEIKDKYKIYAEANVALITAAYLFLEEKFNGKLIEKEQKKPEVNWKKLIEKNNTEEIEEHLKNGYTLSEYDKIWAPTPLFYAVKQSNKEIVALLINNGFDPNISDKHNNTPITKALSDYHYSTTSEELYTIIHMMIEHNLKNDDTFLKMFLPMLSHDESFMTHPDIKTPLWLLRELDILEIKNEFKSDDKLKLLELLNNTIQSIGKQELSDKKRDIILKIFFLHQLKNSIILDKAYKNQTFSKQLSKILNLIFNEASQYQTYLKEWDYKNRNVQNDALKRNWDYYIIFLFRKVLDRITENDDYSALSNSLMNAPTNLVIEVLGDEAKNFKDISYLSKIVQLYQKNLTLNELGLYKLYTKDNSFKKKMGIKEYNDWKEKFGVDELNESNWEGAMKNYMMGLIAPNFINKNETGNQQFSINSELKDIMKSYEDIIKTHRSNNSKN